MYSLLDTSLPERQWQIEQSTKKTTKMFKGLKGNISKERSKDLNMSSSKQEHSLVGRDVYLYVLGMCKHQAEKKQDGGLLGGKNEWNY